MLADVIDIMISENGTSVDVAPSSGSCSASSSPSKSPEKKSAERTQVLCFILIFILLAYKRICRVCVNLYKRCVS